MRSIVEALQSPARDDALVRNFLSVWSAVESTLEAFSRATELPIFVYLDGALVFHSSAETMPPFCKVMLGAPETAARCFEDGKRRALKDEPEVKRGIQLCHAGMINGRREIETGVGTMVILFGARKAGDENATRRRGGVIEDIAQGNAELADRLKQADAVGTGDEAILASDAKLMDAIANILKLLLNATVQFRALSINMAHELSVALLGMGTLAEEMQYLIQEYQEAPHSPTALNEILSTQTHMHTECRLGLYIVRNFLSHTSEARYNEAVKPNFEEIDLNVILTDMVDLYRINAGRKRVTIDASGVAKLPVVRGSAMEIRRLFHNILNNAVKYSYHSVPTAQRVVRIKSKIPYDPGFRQPRFAIAFENYGLGVTDAERASVFKPGFRGQQAIAEVPIGAGIGLSEAAKIMKAHKGQIRFHSKALYESEPGDRTYLTTVEVIFPYKGGSLMER